MRDKDGLCVYEPKPSDPMNKQKQKQNSLLSLFLVHYCHICTQTTTDMKSFRRKLTCSFQISFGRITPLSYKEIP